MYRKLVCTRKCDIGAVNLTGSPQCTFNTQGAAHTPGLVLYSTVVAVQNLCSTSTCAHHRRRCTCVTRSCTSYNESYCLQHMNLIAHQQSVEWSWSTAEPYKHPWNGTKSDILQAALDACVHMFNQATAAMCYMQQLACAGSSTACYLNAWEQAAAGNAFRLMLQKAGHCRCNNLCQQKLTQQCSDPDAYNDIDVTLYRTY